MVFSPHLYSESITVSSELSTLENGFKIFDQAAAWYNAPLWTGEWGWFGNSDEQSSDVDRFMDAMDAMDKYKMGGAWWLWTQACGDPHPVRDGITDQDQGNLNRISCPSGEIWDWSKDSPGRSRAHIHGRRPAP